MLLGRDKPRKRKPRGQLTRRLYSGNLSGASLSLKRGVHIRTTDKDGAIVKDVYDPAIALMCGLGDRLVLTGGGDTIALVEVTKIEPGWNETLHVKVITGAAVDGTVRVLNAKGLRK